MDLQEQANDENDFFKENSETGRKPKTVKRCILIKVINYLILVDNNLIVISIS